MQKNRLLWYTKISPKHLNIHAFKPGFLCRKMRPKSFPVTYFMFGCPSKIEFKVLMWSKIVKEQVEFCLRPKVFGKFLIVDMLNSKLQTRFSMLANWEIFLFFVRCSRNLLIGSTSQKIAFFWSFSLDFKMIIHNTKFWYKFQIQCKLKFALSQYNFSKIFHRIFTKFLGLQVIHQ